jgi:hypothetical protein
MVSAMVSVTVPTDMDILELTSTLKESPDTPVRVSTSPDAEAVTAAELSAVIAVARPVAIAAAVPPLLV